MSGMGRREFVGAVGRRGGLAAWGARTAGGDAGSWIPQQQSA